jgi:hypothetical protein
MDTRELRELAKRATPGPFDVQCADSTNKEDFAKQFLDVIKHGGNDFYYIEGTAFEDGMRKYLAFTGNGPTSKANAEYIAALSPDVLEGLCDELDKARTLIYSTEPTTYWGTYRTGDETVHGGNVAAWYESATFWKKKFEAAQKEGIEPDAIKALACKNTRAEKAEAENERLRDALRRR